MSALLATASASVQPHCQPVSRRLRAQVISISEAGSQHRLKNDSALGDTALPPSRQPGQQRSLISPTKVTRVRRLKSKPNLTQADLFTADTGDLDDVGGLEKDSLGSREVPCQNDLSRSGVPGKRTYVKRLSTRRRAVSRPSDKVDVEDVEDVEDEQSVTERRPRRQVIRVRRLAVRETQTSPPCPTTNTKAHTYDHEPTITPTVKELCPTSRQIPSPDKQSEAGHDCALPSVQPQKSRSVSRTTQAENKRSISTESSPYSRLIRPETVLCLVTFQRPDRRATESYTLHWALWLSDADQSGTLYHLSILRSKDGKPIPADPKVNKSRDYKMGYTFTERFNPSKSKSVKTIHPICRGVAGRALHLAASQVIQNHPYDRAGNNSQNFVIRVLGMLRADGRITDDQYGQAAKMPDSSHLADWTLGLRGNMP